MNQSKPGLERWKKASYPFPERRSERERHIYTHMIDKGSRWEQGRGPEAGEEFQGGSVKAKKKTRGGDMSKTQRERHGRTRELIRTTLLFRPCFRFSQHPNQACDWSWRRGWPRHTTLRKRRRRPACSFGTQTLHVFGVFLGRGAEPSQNISCTSLTGSSSRGSNPCPCFDLPAIYFLAISKK